MHTSPECIRTHYRRPWELPGSGSRAGSPSMCTVFLPALFLCACLGAGVARGFDDWQKCVGNSVAPIPDGFGTGFTQKVQSVESFNGYIYAGVGDDIGSNLASVWRSSDLVYWTNVVPAISNATEILFMTHTDTAVFFGTECNAGGITGQIWRSTDGVAWSLFNSQGDGWTNTGQNIDALGTDGVTLFAGTGLTPTTGGQIWRRPADGSSNWMHLFTLPDGIVPTWVCSIPINGTNTLFLTTSAWPIINPAQAWLLESRDNGDTWTTNAAVGNGFGNTNNLNFAWILLFNDHIYAGMHNSVEGSSLWRVPIANINGPWTQIPQTTNGFGFGAANSELHRATVAAGYLWVATLSGGGLGSQVWRSSDGTNFVQSNMSGFNPAQKASGFDSITGFGTNVVWGGGTTLTGAQIWRTTPDRHSLSVSSAHGLPVPPEGTHWYDGGTMLTNCVSSSDSQWTTQYVCTGWSASGVSPASGAGTNASFSLTNDVVLTWGWRTNYWLTISVSGSGSCDRASDWMNAGTNLTVTATASGSNVFVGWTGDTNGCVPAGNQIGVAMTSPRQITANFSAVVVSNGTPVDWMIQHGLTNDIEDTDVDGSANWKEYVAGTDPTNRQSKFAISNAQHTAGAGFVVSWWSVSNKLYTVGRSTNLLTDGFSPLTNHVPATPPLNVHTDPAAWPCAGYRISVEVH